MYIMRDRIRACAFKIVVASLSAVTLTYQLKDAKAAIEEAAEIHAAGDDAENAILRAETLTARL